MTDDQVNIAVNPSVFVFAHLVRKNSGGVVILRICGGAGWPADILPTFTSISAVRHPALFDADEDFIWHTGVQRDAADVGSVWWRGKGPLVVIRQSAKCGQLTKRATAVFTDIDGGRQRTDVELVGAAGMNLHRPDITKIDAAGGQPFPVVAAVFTDVNLRQRRRVEALRVSGVPGDFAEGFLPQAPCSQFLVDQNAHPNGSEQACQ